MDVQESHELCVCVWVLYALTCIPCVYMCMQRCMVQVACLLDSLSTKSRVSHWILRSLMQLGKLVSSYLHFPRTQTRPTVSGF